MEVIETRRDDDPRHQPEGGPHAHPPNHVGKGRFEVGRRILGHLRLIQKDNVNGSQATLAFMTSLLTNNDVSP